MRENKIISYLNELLGNMPNDWLKLTTHRLDIYDEEQAKTEFLGQLDDLYIAENAETSALASLPTAYDYIRLGHPLSCVLEWSVGKLHGFNPSHVVCFSSSTMPVLSILRKNLLAGKATQIVHFDPLPAHFDPDTIRRVYGYKFEVEQIENISAVPSFEGSTVLLSSQEDLFNITLSPAIDFFVSTDSQLGSLLVVNGEQNSEYIPEIQHVRRRESIAMTPANCLIALQVLTGKKTTSPISDIVEKKASVLKSIKAITGSDTPAVIGSSGLSIQYGIMMGLIDYATAGHPDKPIKIVVPPNCYGGTNDQARRVAACLDHVEIVDLPVDGQHDMVDSLDRVLEKVAKEDAVALIIVEIPTNPRVEVPNLDQLKKVLSEERKTKAGDTAVEPIFILDQTFCPNVPFLGENDILSSIKAISYVSGSKFPSGGLCTAGYCLANKKGELLMKQIALHLKLCDNEATDLQVKHLAEQLPSMNQRIKEAYKNTRAFVKFIETQLPEAKINFVSEELAKQDFTPSVFSLDLPTKGDSPAEREAHKRALNHKLIEMMITEIPDESKYCVSYGQLKGCYWTIPATSTQGTTKEKDKDYIARVSCSPDMNIERHQQVFLDFVEQME